MAAGKLLDRFAVTCRPEDPDTITPGVSIISQAMFALLSAGDTLLYSRRAYPNTIDFFERHLARLGIRVFATGNSDIAHLGPNIAEYSQLSPVPLRPLDAAVDIVLHSLTKIIGGFGSAMGAVAAGRAELINPIARGLSASSGLSRAR